VSDFEILPPVPQPTPDIENLLKSVLGPEVEFEVEEQVDERYSPRGVVRFYTGFVRITIRCPWWTTSSLARADEFDSVCLKLIAICEEARGLTSRRMRLA